MCNAFIRQSERIQKNETAIEEDEGVELSSIIEDEIGDGNEETKEVPGTCLKQ
jgi:hypothetical protein